MRTGHAALGASLPDAVQDILVILRRLFGEITREALQSEMPAVMEAALARAPSTSAANIPRMLTTADVAKIFQVAVDTVLGWINSGELQAMKISREWRIDPDALEDFKQNQRMKLSRFDLDKEAASIVNRAAHSGAGKP